LLDLDIAFRPCTRFETLLTVFQRFGPGQMIPTFHRVLKGHPRRHIDGLLEFFTKDPEVVRGTFEKGNADTGIPESMLRTWQGRRNTEGQESCFPLVEGHSKAQVLEETTEDAIADHILVNFIEAGIRTSRATIKMLCLNACETQENSPRDIFPCRSTFLRDFERREGLSLRAARHEKRPIADER
jgi:hypothetical protein